MDLGENKTISKFQFRKLSHKSGSLNFRIRKVWTIILMWRWR